MSDSTLGLTFLDLRIRVAEFLGIAYYGNVTTEAAQLPLDAHDLDLVNRLVNDGYRRFLGDHDRWHFLDVPLAINFVTQYSGTATGGSTTTLVNSGIAGTYADDFFNGFALRVTHADETVTVYTVADYTGASGTFTFVASTAVVAADTYEVAGPTAVEGQNFRYYMPDDFMGVFLTPLTYDVGGPRIKLNPVDEGRIRELRSGANTSGTPSVYALRPINVTAATNSKRWEMLVWPAPTGTERVTAQYKRYPLAFTDITGTATGNGSTTTFVDTGLIGTTSVVAGQKVRLGASDPVLYTITNVNTGTGVVTFTPAATSTTTGEAYRVFQDQRSVAGFQHDRTLMAACFAEAEAQRNDTIGVREQAYLSALANSIKLDGRSQPVRRQDYGDTSEDQGYPGRRPLNYYGVDTYTNANGSVFSSN